MNDYLILATLLLCHIVGDFYLQSRAMVHGKRFGERRESGVVTYPKATVIKAHIKHMLIHAGLMAVALLILLAIDVIRLTYERLWLAVGSIAVGHLLVDLAKSWLRRKSHQHAQAVKVLIVDQLAHLAVILGVWVWLFDNLSNFSGMLTVDHFIIAGAYLLALKPTSILISQLLLPYSLKNDDTQIPKAGQLIGYIERVVVLTLIFVNQYTAIGFIIAAKSVLRYGEHGGKNTKLNEYVLLGTLASFGLVLLVGILARLALGLG